MPEIALNERYIIKNYVDSFALGHYARVLEAVDLSKGQTVALKVMRPEHLDREAAPKWEAQAFPHEADLLMRLADHPTPVRLLDCGYLSASGEYPSSGILLSFGTNAAAFREGLYANIARGWRPYLALEYLPREHNLLYQMQVQRGQQRRRLPTEEGIDLAMQFGTLLQAAHSQGIVYMDHKLEHIYWDGETLRIIDWNSSKLLEPGRQTQTLDNSRQKDIHHLCVGVLYPIFTGLSPQRGGLRPQPAGMTEVDARYSDVQHLDFSVEPSLSSAITDLLESGARQDLPTADYFLRRLEQVAVKFGWESYIRGTEPALKEARDYMRDGLAKLRHGEDLVREALNLLIEAASIEDINDDMDAELRRLMKGINEFLNARVIP